jgi:hypothetical protein
LHNLGVANARIDYALDLAALSAVQTPSFLNLSEEAVKSRLSHSRENEATAL